MFLQRLNITEDTDDTKKRKEYIGKKRNSKRKRREFIKASVKLVIYEALLKKKK